MNKEIEELLNELKDEDNYIEEYGYSYKRIALNDCWLLLSYIEQIEDKINWYENIDINKTIDKFRVEHNKEIKKLHNKIEQLETTVKDYKQKLNQYEDPDDLTLFYMWLDTKAKDKMKQMEHEVTSLKQHNAMITKLSENIKEENQKLVKVIEKLKNKDDILGEFEDWLEKQKYRNSEWGNFVQIDNKIGIPIHYILNKLTELKGDSE